MFTRPLADHGPRPTPYTKGYLIIKFNHPDGGGGTQIVEHVDTLEEAQEICKAPEASFKEGATSEWWFLGYADASSNTWWHTPWQIVKNA